MTERSYLWDGIATGDASLAPYNAEEFLKYFTLPRSDNNEGVVPGYLGSLEPSFSGDNLSSVLIKAGAAIVNGSLYVLDEDFSLPIDLPAVALGTRLDYLVLRASDSDVRLTLVEGSPSLTAPAVPTILSDDFPIAVIYSDTQIADGYVYDRRKFLTNVVSDSIQSHQNLIKNSEGMVYSLAAGNAPEWWTVTGSAAASTPYGTVPTTVVTRFGGTRGRYFTINALAALSATETFNTALTQTIQAGGGRVFTLKGVINLGATAYPSPENRYVPLTVTLAGYDVNGTLVAYRKERYRQPVEETVAAALILPFKFTKNFSEDISSLVITVEVEGQFSATQGTAGLGRFGQFVLTTGYDEGFQTEEQELIVQRDQISDTSWDGDAKSDATTTIDLDTDYGGDVLDGAYAVGVKVSIRDSGSAGVANNFLKILTMDGVYVGSVRIEGETNQTWRSGYIIVPIDEAHQFQIEVNASGAGTLDAIVAIMGILI